MHTARTPPTPLQQPEPPSANGAPPAKLPELPFTELDIAALRENAPAAPPRPAAAKPRSAGAGKNGGSRPLTELDMMVLRGKDQVPTIQWPQKHSFIEVAW